MPKVVKNLRNRRQGPHRLIAPLFLLGLLLVAVFLGKATFDIYQKAALSKKEVLQAQARLDDLKERETFVTNEIARLNTVQGVEAELREKFGVARPGEKTIVIVGAEDSDGEGKTEEGLFREAWNAFLSWF